MGDWGVDASRSVLSVTRPPGLGELAENGSRADGACGVPGADYGNA